VIEFDSSQSHIDHFLHAVLKAEFKVHYKNRDGRSSMKFAGILTLRKSDTAGFSFRVAFLRGATCTCPLYSFRRTGREFLENHQKFEGV